MSTLPALPPGFPGVLWRRVEATLHPTSDEHPSDVADEVVRWIEGRSPEDLGAVLDALRSAGAYAVSLEVLEAAWNAELPLDLHGRVAEDWIGTVLHGVGDRAGAEVVAQHLVSRAQALGPAFAGDLGHLCLEWDLNGAADALVRFAAAALPGDTALQFALGVVCKLAGEWSESAAAFEAVLRQRPDERSAWWSLGIARTALSDWAGARAAWQALGFTLPGDAGDFASAGAPTPVRLPAAPGAPARYEVVWGRRLCPARVRLEGLPRFPHLADHGDVVLVDGVAVGETAGAEGQPVAILPALAPWGAARGWPRFMVAGPQRAHTDRDALQRAVARLHGEGWPAADWTGLDGAPHTLALGLIVPSGRTAGAAASALAAAIGDLPLQCPALLQAAGLPPETQWATLRPEGPA